MIHHLNDRGSIKDRKNRSEKMMGKIRFSGTEVHIFSRLKGPNEDSETRGPS